jgi:hypothetical protein
MPATPWLLFVAALFVQLAATPGALAADPPYPFHSSVPPADYDMTVQVLPAARRLEVSGTMVIAAAAAARPDLEIELGETMPKLEVGVVAPPGLAGPVRLERKGKKDGQALWKATFSKPLPAGKALTLRYRCAGGDKIGFVFSLGPEVSFASGLNTAWYPHVLAGGEDRRAVGRVHYFVPPGYVVVSAGDLSSSAAEQAGGSFLFAAARPGYFTFAAARFAVSSHQGKVPTKLFLLRPRPDGAALTRRLSAIIDFLATQFGPFPYAGLSIVETPHDPSHQAGFSGADVGEIMFVDGDMLDGDFVLAFYAHELGHSWWGNLVDAPRYLDETMAQFGSLQAVEALEGEQAAERYRRTGYPGYAALQCALGYLMLSAAGFDHPVADLPDDRISPELADGKGMFVVDMLSRLAGRPAFTGALRALIRQKAYDAVSWKDILDAAQSQTARDLHGFFAEWFQRPGAPTLSLHWTQAGDNVSGYVSQTPPYYSASLDLELRSREGKILSQTLFVQGARTDFQFHTRLAAQDVLLDPHYRVLRWTPELHAEALALWPYWRTTVEGWKSGD